MVSEEKTPDEAGPGERPYRSGFVAIIGPANAGKSTLLNALLGAKVSIVSPRAQTTRNQILGIKTLPEAQLVFMDSPGFLRTKLKAGPNALAQFLTEAMKQAAADADVRLLVLDGEELLKDGGLLEVMKEFLTKEGISHPDVIALNKIDLFEHRKLLPLLELTDKQFRAGELDIVPVSALKQDGLDVLEREIVRRLPGGPQYFPEDQLSDQSERFLAAEIIREKLFFHLQQELPYSAAVQVEQWEEAEELLRIAATILVERESQKGIVIGKGGEMLKKIGSSARKELERILGTHIYLEIVVRVEPNWTRTRQGLRRAGYRS